MIPEVHMAEIAIIGDGPGGLSAALFLAKAGHTVRVFGEDQTVMHYAFLYNYLGIPGISGTEFQQRAQAQVAALGVERLDRRATGIAVAGDRFEVTTEGEVFGADYVVLSEGKRAPLAASLGLDTQDGTLVVDRNGRSSLARVYVVGRSARPTRSQAIISAGDGAAAALDILASIKGTDVQDWDAPPKDD